MRLVRYNPLRDLQKMERDLDKIWDNNWGLLPSLTDLTTMDLYEESGKLVAEVSLPNFKKDEVKVTADEGMLEISAEHQEKKEDKDKRRYYFRESSNRYLRRVTLPEGTKTDEVEAEFKDGVLKVSMPTAKPARIEAKSVPIK
jgi:HSP20 family protein